MASSAPAQTMHSTTLGWRMVNPRMPERWTISNGESAELLAERYGIDRERQDAFALASHRGARAAAWEAGFYGDWVRLSSGSSSSATRTSARI